MKSVITMCIFLFIFMQGSLSTLWGKEQKSDSSQFYFIQISDTHFGERDHYLRIRKVIDEINQLPVKIEFVALTGDIVADRIDKSEVLDHVFKEMNRLTVPIHYLPGNHDILFNKFVAFNLKKTRNIYRQKFGPLLTTQLYHNVNFIFMYTEPLAKDFKLEGYNPLKELQNQLDKLDQKPVILCHHRPSVKDFYLNRFHKSWKKSFRKQWIELLNQHNVKAVIAGHFHRDELHWLGNIPLFISPPVSGYRGRQSTFRIYEYKKGQVSYRTQYVQ